MLPVVRSPSPPRTAGGGLSLPDLADSDRRCRVALLWPPGFDPATSIPLPLGYLAACLPTDRFEVRLFDCVLDGLDASSPVLRRELTRMDPDVVGVSAWSPMFPEALELLRAVRSVAPRAITVLGGAHAGSYPERCLDHPEIDCVVRGEAERSFPALLDQLRSASPDLSTVAGLVYRDADGGVVLNEADRIPDLDSLPLPDYRAIRLDDYNARGYRWNTPPVPNAPIWLTRGCPYRCQYCATPTLNGRPIRAHSPEYALRWIRHLYDEHGIRWFNIIDDNFTFHGDWAKQMCRALIRMQLPGARFGTPNGVRMQRGDPELWSLMKRAGWDQLVVAPESGSPRTLARMKKDLDLDAVPGIVQQIKDAGLRCAAFFIVGYPGETPEDLRLTRALIRRCRFNFVFLASFQPLPGTPVYDDLVASGEIPDGLLPFAFSDGVRVYTPPGLRGFNLSKWVAGTHLMMALTHPRNLPYHAGVLFRRYEPAFVLRKALKTAWGAVRSGAQEPRPRTVGDR